MVMIEGTKTLNPWEALSAEVAITSATIAIAKNR
jgi:hypothetical protein